MKIIFVTTCKPILGENIKNIQSNSINSWINLPIDKKIIILNKDSSVVDFCNHFEVELITEFESSDLTDLPTFRSMIKSASDFANNDDIIIWSNCDIIFDKTLVDNIIELSSFKKELVLVGRRKELKIDRILLPFEFDNLYTSSEKMSDYAIDYFIFRKNMFDDLPHFFVARQRFDNYLLSYCIKKYLTIDCTNTINCFHQSHGHGDPTKGDFTLMMDNDWRPFFESDVYNIEQSFNDSNWLSKFGVSSLENCEFYTILEANKITLKNK